MLIAVASMLALTVMAHAAAPMSAAKLAWHGPPAAAGEVLKARISAVIAQELLRPGATWALRAGNQDVPAGLTGVSATADTPQFSLPFTQYDNTSGAEIIILIDRGAQPQPLNTLHFEILAPSLNCTAQVVASDDSHGQTGGGQAQVLYQAITAGRILALTDLTITVGQQRWLRVTLNNAKQAQIKSVKGQNLPPVSALSETLVSLGTMLDGKQAGTQIQPLSFGEPQGLIYKLEFMADAPGTVCEIAIATLDTQGQPLRTVAQGLWADRITSGTAQRSAYSLSVPGLDPQGKYGLVVSAAPKPLVFTGAKAYAREAWIVFSAPASGDLTLWLNPTDLAPPPHVEFDPAQARTVGEFEAPVSYAMPKGTEPVRNWLPEPLAAAQTGLIRWWRTAAYGLGALVLCGVGLGLLRRRPAEDDVQA